MLRRVIGLMMCSVASLAAQSAVTGTVFDSLVRRPLVGAVAQLYGPLQSTAPRIVSAITDSLGVFRMPGVEAGRYVAGFFHPSIDSLGIELAGKTVEIGARTARVDLATPSADRLGAIVCPGSPPTDSTGAIIGFVRESATERPMASAHVHARWDEFGIDKRGAFSSMALNASSETTMPGWFAVCGVPVAVPLIVSADDGTDTTGFIGVQLEAHTVGHLTMHIAHAARARDGVVPDTALARIAGTVVDEDGHPVIGAQVTVWQTKLGASTNERGSFTLDRLGAGSRTIEIRAIGMSPLRRAVDLVAGETISMNVKVQRAVAIPGMETRAQVLYSRGLTEFQRHMRTSPGGYFVRPTEVGEHAGQDLVGLTRSAPSVVVTQGSDHRWLLMMVSPGAASITEGGLRTCSPPIFLNGRRSLMDFDDLVVAFPSDEILGLEVYNHLSQVPSDYQVDISSPCGAISLWTRPPDGTFKKRTPRMLDAARR